MGDNIDESWIVTSTGPYIVIWNFNKVKQKKLYEYKVLFGGCAVYSIYA
jgi:hypothetical protein